MIKKLFLLLMAAVTLFSTCACSGEGAPVSTDWEANNPNVAYNADGTASPRIQWICGFSLRNGTKCRNGWRRLPVSAHRRW